MCDTFASVQTYSFGNPHGLVIWQIETHDKGDIRCRDDAVVAEFSIEGCSISIEVSFCKGQIILIETTVLKQPVASPPEFDQSGLHNEFEEISGKFLDCESLRHTKEFPQNITDYLNELKNVVAIILSCKEVADFDICIPQSATVNERSAIPRGFEFNVASAEVTTRPHDAMAEERIRKTLVDKFGKLNHSGLAMLAS